MGAIKKSTLRRRERAKRTRRLIFTGALILVLLLVSSVFYVRFENIAFIQAKIDAQLEKQEKLQQENENLQSLLAKKDDPEYIEYLARKKLGLIKPGEEKYIIVDP